MSLASVVVSAKGAESLPGLGKLGFEETCHGDLGVALLLCLVLQNILPCQKKEPRLILISYIRFCTYVDENRPLDSILA